MSRNVVSAKLDIIFKKFFSENHDMLKDFISGILEIPIEKIEEIVIKGQELPPENIDGKFSRLDLCLKVDDKLVNVEVQINNAPNYRDRAMFYWAKLFTSELESGDNYAELKQTITVNILNFDMFPDRKDYHTEITAVFRDTGEIFYDKFRIHFFELKKLGNSSARNRRELWLKFINAESEEDFDMIQQTNDPVMEKAVRIIYDMSKDTLIREAARMREKALHDEAFFMEGARAEGRAEGLAEGRAEGRAEGKAEGIAEGREQERASILEKMKRLGLSDEQIDAVLNK